MWLGKKCTRTGQWMVPLKPTSSTHTSAPALPNPYHTMKFITLEGSRTQSLRFDLNQAFQSISSTSMNLPGVTVPHTCARQELYTSELYALPNSYNVADEFHPINENPLVTMLDTKSHGPMRVLTGCSIPFPTASTPRNSSSLHFGYGQVAFHILETSSQKELAKCYHQTVGFPQILTFIRSIWDHHLQWKTFPGLSYERIRKHLPPSMATYQGHMIHT